MYLLFWKETCWSVFWIHVFPGFDLTEKNIYLVVIDISETKTACVSVPRPPLVSTLAAGCTTLRDLIRRI